MYAMIRQQQEYERLRSNYDATVKEYVALGGNVEVTSSSEAPQTPHQYALTIQRIAQLQEIKIIDAPSAEYTSADILAAQEYERASKSYDDAAARVLTVSVRIPPR